MNRRAGQQLPPAEIPDDQSVALEFGDCLLDLHRRELRRADEVVPLEPRIFDLLAFMAGNPHKALSKDELQAQIWPGLVVSDAVFSQAIMKARRAVGDSGQQQSVIATIHGYGYRFVAEVRALATAVDQNAPADPPGAENRADDQTLATAAAAGRRRRSSLLAATAVLALAVVALSWLLRPDSPASIEPAIIALLSNASASIADSGPGETARDIDASALLARALNGQQGMTVIASDRATRLLSAQGIAPDADDGVVLTALNQALGVDYLLRAGLVLRDDQWQLDATLIDRQLRRTELPASHGSLVAMVTGMGHQLGAELGRNWREDLPGSVLSEDDFANEAAARGLQALLAGDA
ncbi:MAG: winged helix-turn-helix domain-containing protein, partial [Lysobacterales bacterium]